MAERKIAAGKSASPQTQLVTVDVRKLGLGMSHAFQGMAEVCASLGVLQGDLLSAVDSSVSETATEQKESDAGATGTKGTKGGKKNGSEAEPPAGLDDPVGNDGAGDVAGDAAVTEDDAPPTEEKSLPTQDASPPTQDASPSTEDDSPTPKATVDDISRILTAKVKQKKIQAADAKALLEKYGATSVSKLDPKYYDAFLEEASSL